MYQFFGPPSILPDHIIPNYTLGQGYVLACAILYPKLY